MKKLFFILSTIVSISAHAAGCAPELQPLCDAASSLKEHKGIYLQINPTANVRFEQSGVDGFVSINERGELAERYGTDGEAARTAVLGSVDAVRKLASHKREAVYLIVTSRGGGVRMTSRFSG